MTRIRSLKPAFFRSSSVANLPISARLTWAGLWTYFDDHGYGRDDARLVKAEIWPLDETHTAKRVEGDLRAIADQNMICRFEVDGCKYMHAPKWAVHQRVNRPQASLIPHCPTHVDSVNDHDSISDRSLNPHRKISEPTVIPHGPITESTVNDHCTNSVGSGSGSGSGSGIPSSPLASLAVEPDSDEVKTTPKADLTDQQSNPDDPPAEPPSPAAQALIDRWLAVVAKPHNPLRKAEAERVIPQLVAKIDWHVLDELIGKCAADATEPPATIRYLLAACRSWVDQHHAGIDLGGIL